MGDVFTRRSVGVTLGFLIAVVCFLTPWFMPIRPSISESYALGFSNLTFLLLVIFLLIPFAYFYDRFIMTPPPAKRLKLTSIVLRVV